MLPCKTVKVFISFDRHATFLAGLVLLHISYLLIDFYHFNPEIYILTM